MSVWIMACGVAGGLILAQSSVTAFPLSGELLGLAEANAQCKFPGTYTLSNLWCRVLTNNGTHTLITRKGGANGTQAISITGTGTFEDTTHTEAVASGDLWNTQLTVGGSHNNTATLTLVSLLVDDGGTLTPVFQATGGGGHSATTYLPLSGGRAGVNQVSEIANQKSVRVATTLSLLRTAVQANANTLSSTIRTRVNGTNGGQSVSYSSTLTGIQEDVTGSDTITAGDNVCYQAVPGSSANLAIDTVQAKAAAAGSLLMASYGQTASTTGYLTISGRQPSFATTESDVQMKARTVKTFDAFFTATATNTRSDATTVDLRVNAASPGGGPAVSIGANTSGIVEGLTGTVTTTATDLLNFRVLIGGGTGSITLSTIGIQQDDGLPSGFTPAVTDALTLGELVPVLLPRLPLSVTDALTLTDSPTLAGLLLTRLVSEAISLGETPLSVVVFVQPVVADSVVLSEPVTIRIVTLPFAVQDAITVGDTVSVLVPFLAPGVLDGLTLGETLNFTTIEAPTGPPMGSFALTGVGL
jgi:hypothetical protein